MTEKMSLRMWIALIGLAFCSFVFNTSEFIPVGLLTDIATDFSKTEAQAGMLISVYAWFVMLLSLPLMVLTTNIELKKLLCWLVALFSIFQTCAYFSGSFGMLMASRIGVACTHAIFWSIVTPLAVKIVPKKFAPMAITMVATGSSVAMVLGVPLGRMIGLMLGWRMTFLSIGIASFITFIYIMSTLPRVPAEGKFSLNDVPQLLKNKALRSVYLLALLIPLAHYTAYGYIEPFLLQVANLSEDTITTILVCFGVAGFLGSLLFARFYRNDPRAFRNITLSAVCIALGAMAVSAGSTALSIATCCVWGVAMTAFNVAMQDEIIARSPKAGTSVSMSIFSGIYNLGIGTGAFVGGAVCSTMGIANIGYVGAAVVFITLIMLRLNILSFIAPQKANNIVPPRRI